MDMKRVAVRFMVQKVGSFVVKDRVLCFGDYSFSTYDRDNQLVTNTWPYEDVDGCSLMEGETDFVIFTPRHRIKKTVYRCSFRMEVLVTLMRLRSQHKAKAIGKALRPELETHVFQCLKYLKRDLHSSCTLEIGPAGIYQKDSEDEVVSYIPYPSLVSIDLIVDSDEAIVLNHAENSSLFLVQDMKRTELAKAIHRVIKLFNMQVNEYDKKTMAMACKEDRVQIDGLSCQFQVQKASTNGKVSSPRTLSISEKYLTECVDQDVVILSRPLSRIYAILLVHDSTQAFEVVFSDGVRRMYCCERRERVVCELLTSCHALGNHQIDVTSTTPPAWMKMVPSKIIQQDAARIVTKVRDANVSDRELRAVQGSILQQIATHGYGKTARMQRQLPKGIDEEMHSLAQEFNANTPTPGVIAQPNKPFEKVAFVIAREIQDIVNRHGPAHEFVVTYLQTLYRLMNAPPAIKEFVGIIIERREEYIGTISDILGCKNSLSVYWMLMVLECLFESKVHKLQCRDYFLSKNPFVITLLTLYEEDMHTQLYLSDLPTMKLCQLVLSLVKTNVEKQQKRSQTFYENLATKFRMLQRILFGFPSLGTVEACVGILSRMTNHPSSIVVGGGTIMDSAYRVDQVPQHSLTFGENLNYGAPSQRGGTLLSSRHGGIHNGVFSKNNSFSLTRRLSSSSSSGSMNGNAGVAVQNPEVLLRQYRLFLESASGPLKKRLDQYSDSISLRLRFRCRNVFLQELMSHMMGKFDEFKRVFNVECYQFSGFLGTSNGQREKSDLFLTPRALIAVRVMNRYTHEIEYRAIEEITEAADFPEAFMLIVKQKPQFIYSDESKMIIQKIKELAGVIGIHLRSTSCEHLPKRPIKISSEKDAKRLEGCIGVQKRSGSHGFTRFRKKQICFVDGKLFEIDGDIEKAYPLKDLRRVIAPSTERYGGEALISLEFCDGKRIVYVPEDVEIFLGLLYDGYLESKTWGVTLAREFSRINPKMTPRALMHDDSERQFYLNNDGLYIPMHEELTKQIKKMNGEGMMATSATDKLIFALESLNMNVEAGDFAGKTLQNRIGQLSFGPILNSMIVLLQHSCKPPVRTTEVSVILDAFCRINNGSYKMVIDAGDSCLALIPILAQVVVSGETIATVWSINAIHSMVVDRSRMAAHKDIEKRIRNRIFDQKKLIQILLDVLDQQKGCCSLAVLNIFIDVLIVSRELTDNTHFDTMIKALSAKYGLLLQLANQRENAGLAIAGICMLKMIVEFGDARGRQRICDTALESGLTVKDIYNSFFHFLDIGRETYQRIGAIWIVYHKPSYELLARMLPHGVLRMISHASTKKTIQRERDARLKAEAKRNKKKSMSVDAEKRSVEWFISRVNRHLVQMFPENTSSAAKIKEDNSRINYPGESASDLGLLYELLNKDFVLPDLIWNEETRNELKIVLERSLKAFEDQKTARLAAPASITTQKMGKDLLWNHKQFKVQYESIAREPQVGRFYLRVILEKIKDGSLQLNNVAKALEANSANGNHNKARPAGVSDDLFHASMEIAKAPLKFFDEVYQCWLENLHLATIGQYGAGQRNSSRCEISDLAHTEEYCDWMLKILVELARVFPSVRVIGKNRAQFLMRLLESSFLAGEIEDVVELISQVSHSSDGTDQFCCKNTVLLFLHMSSLAHRRRIRMHTQIDDDDEIPIMEWRVTSNTDRLSSFYLPTFSEAMNTRYNLKWRVKRVLGDVGNDSVIDGPFSIFEFKNYLDNDLASVRDGTGIFACCCSNHDENDQNIHTWKPLFELPELRWMELTDVPVEPLVISTHALRVLRNFLLNEKISSFDVNVWPLPIAKSVASGPASLAALAQLLLVSNRTIRALVCEILASVSDEALVTLYSFGTFFFLFSTEIESENTADLPTFVDEARLLQKIHRIQKCNETRPGQSYLLNLLPESFVNIFDTDTPEQIADIYTSRTTDKRVFWSSAMRKHLQEMLGEHIDEFKQKMVSDVTITYRYLPIPPITYMELSHDVYCSGYYLSTVAETDIDINEIEEPLILMRSIEEKWRYLVGRQMKGLDKPQNYSSAFKVFGWDEDMSYSFTDLRDRYRILCHDAVEVTSVRHAYEVLLGRLESKDEVDTGRTSDDVIDTILKSQLKLLEKFPVQFLSFESKTLDLLLKLLSESSVNSVSITSRRSLCETYDFRGLSMEILYRLLTAAPQNVELLLEVEGCWNYIIETVEDYSANDHDNDEKLRGLHILRLIIDSESGRTSLVEESKNQAKGEKMSKNFGFEHDDAEESGFFSATEYNGASKSDCSKRIFTLLETMLLSNENTRNEDLQNLLFDIVTSFCRNPVLQDQMMVSTRIFWKGLHIILTGAGTPSSIYGAQNGLGDRSQSKRDELESAFRAMRGLAIGPDGQTPTKGLDVLSNLLPVEFLKCLNKPSGHDFCTILASDISEPTCIWNDNTRYELMQLTEEYYCDRSGDELSLLESSMSHMYDCLKSEPFVGGIYLLILLEKATADPYSITIESLRPSNATEFLESLFLFLNENRDPKTGIYSDTLPVLECLSILADLPEFRVPFAQCLEDHVDDVDAVNASVSVATLGRYLLPFDRDQDGKAVSISSRRSLSNYGFKKKNQKEVNSDGLPSAMIAEFGNPEYLYRQELALVILIKVCGFQCGLEKMLAPFCQYTWALQVIADHLGYEQAFYALSCLAELCDTCLVIAQYVESSGLWVEVLGIALQSKPHVLHEHFLRAEALREPAFEVLYALLSKDFSIRERMYAGLCRFLPYPIVYQIHLDPSNATKFFDDNHEKSDLIWNSHWRTEVRKKLDSIITRNRIQRSKIKRDSVELDDPDDCVRYPENFVAGLYLNRFLSRPDPEKLTNPAYNLELLFTAWREQLESLMSFDLQNPPDNLKSTADMVDKLTTAMTLIMRAPVQIEENIASSQMPEQIVKLVRHCNKHLITSFPYRCVLRIARRLVQFPEMRSREFLELLFCRITMEHSDIPALLKLVRRILEARSTALSEDTKKTEHRFILRDLKYFVPMIKFLESILERKQDMDSTIISNVHRVMRIIKTEQQFGTREENLMSQSFMERASARWHNFTLSETHLSRGTSLQVPDEKEEKEESPSHEAITAQQTLEPILSATSMRSFDVDNEREPSIHNGTFNVDEERELSLTEFQPPPKSINYDAGRIELQDTVPAPKSFRYDGDAKSKSASPLPSPKYLYSRHGADFEPQDNNYHSRKAVQYLDESAHVPTTTHRGSVPDLREEKAYIDSTVTASTQPAFSRDLPPPPSTNDFASQYIGALPSTQTPSQAPSTRRYSLLDNWKPPGSVQSTNSSLTSLTISRRGRRAAAVYSRRKSKAPKRWFG